jgi:hypothetical protein
LANKPNPLNLNTLQLKTLTLLQAIARESGFADPPDESGAVTLKRLPHAHGDHFHIGHRVVMSRDATGLDNPNVYGLLARKGLVAQSDTGAPMVTALGLAYETGIESEILHGSGH